MSEDRSPSDAAISETAASAPAGPTRPASLRPGSRVGRYKLEGPLGQGAMATVYAARDLTLHRQVALKLIFAGDDDEAAHRLVREAQAIARVSHRNVVQVFDVGRDERGMVYVAMEKIDGETLDRKLAKVRSLADKLALLTAAGRGLAAAHDAGLVHRDFKPQNVMVGQDGEVRVLDFGLACAADPEREIDSGGRMAGLLVGAGARATAAGALIGTPAYMSPEQWSGRRADARSDQFAFGVCLYEALAGHHPFETSSRQALREAVLAGDARALPRSLPRRAKEVIARAMAVAPDKRFPSMHALVRALDAPRRTARFFGGAAAIGAAIAVVVLSTRRDVPAPAPRADAAALYHPALRLTARGDLARAAVSPDEKMLAYVTRDALLIQPLARDAEPRTLLRAAMSHDALAWSPDGAELAVFGKREGAAEVGLWLVPAEGGAPRTIALAPGSVAHLGDGELAYARFTDKALTFLATPRASGTEPTRRSCPLPPPFSGVRALTYLPRRDAILIQLDIGDRASKLLRVDRGCRRFETVAPSVQALSYVVRAADERVLVRLMYRHDLVELGDDGAPGKGPHVVLAGEYQPVAVLADGSLVHLESSVRWQLWERQQDGAPRELAAGVELPHFALAPDGRAIALVSGVYRDGVLRVAALDALSSAAVTIAREATRSAWSPRGDRLAVLLQSAHGYELAVWDRASGELGPRHEVALPYDAELTWVDDRRVALGQPPAWRGFAWIDPASGERGALPIGDGEAVRALVRSPDNRRLAFITEADAEVRVWTLPVPPPGATAPELHVELAAAVATGEPRASRRPQLAWPKDALLLWDRGTGELWTISGGEPTSLERLHLPRSGGHTKVGEVLPRGDGLLYSTVTASGDVFISARR